MKKITILTISIIILLLTSCNPTKDWTINDYGDHMNEIFHYISTQTDAHAQAGYIDESGDDQPHVVIELHEDDTIDFYKLEREIYREFGRDVKVVFILIPFPDKALVKGYIQKVDFQDDTIEKSGYRILVVNYDEIYRDGSPEAYHVSIGDDTEIVDENGQLISIEELKNGMIVSIYTRMMTLDTYPGQTGAELVVVESNKGFDLLSDTIAEDIYESKFNGELLSVPMSAVMMGFNEMLVFPFNDIVLVELGAYDGKVYYDMSTDQVEPKYYEGEIWLQSYELTKYTNKIHHSIEGSKLSFETLLPLDFELVAGDANGDGKEDFVVPFYDGEIWVDRVFTIDDEGLVIEITNGS